MLSRFVIAFLPRSKCLLISWLKSPSTVILEPKKIKPVTLSIFSPTYLPRSDGTRSLTRVWLSLWFQLPPARKSQDRGTRNTAPWGCSQQTQSAGTSTVQGPRPKCRGKKGWMWNLPSKRLKDTSGLTYWINKTTLHFLMWVVVSGVSAL